MLHGKKELNIEIVNAFYLYLQTYSAHSNYNYQNKELFHVCEEEANEHVSIVICINLIKNLYEKIL
jgi:predicted N-acyltransferase